MARKQARRGRRAKGAKTVEKAKPVAQAPSGSAAVTRMLVLRLPRDLVEELDAVVAELQKEIPILRLTASQILEHVVAQRLVGLHKKQERVRVVEDVQQELRARMQQNTAEAWRTRAVARSGR